MPKPPIIDSERSYTFADYFRLKFAPRDILAYFDVTLQRQVMTFIAQFVAVYYNFYQIAS